MPTVQDIYPCLVRIKQGNILCQVCITNMLLVSELKCNIYAQKYVFQAKMSSNDLELTSNG